METTEDQGLGDNDAMALNRLEVNWDRCSWGARGVC